MNTRTAIALWVGVSLFLVIIGVGTNAGLLAALAMGVPLVVISLVLCLYFNQKLDADLPAIFLVAVAVRWLASTGIHLLIYDTRPALFGPDEYVYDISAQWYALYMKGLAPHPFGGETPGFILMWTGAIYYVFGHAPLAPKFFNAILGGWTAVCTALIAGYAYSSQVARRAGFLAALFPSLVLWSAILMKDTDTLLSAQIALLSFLSLRHKLNPIALATFGAALVVMGLDRPYEIMFVAAAVGASLLLVRGGSFVRQLVMVAALAALLLVIIQRSGAHEMFVAENEQSLIERVSKVRSGYAEGTGSAINISLVDTSSLGGLILWIPIGLVYFFLAPFPFTGGSVIALATSPEMLVCYAYLPYLVRGLREAVTRRVPDFTPILLYLFVSSVGWSVVVGNVGTIYRYRAQILFVLLILVAAELVKRKEGPEAVYPAAISS
jgi:4-amino-4-deoxy-L-arabinose transferase-like glycosyltransferase